MTLRTMMGLITRIKAGPSPLQNPNRPSDSYRRFAVSSIPKRFLTTRFPGRPGSLSLVCTVCRLLTTQMGFVIVEVALRRNISLVASCKLAVPYTPAIVEAAIDCQTVRVLTFLRRITKLRASSKDQ